MRSFTWQSTRNTCRKSDPERMTDAHRHTQTHPDTHRHTHKQRRRWTLSAALHPACAINTGDGKRLPPADRGSFSPGQARRGADRLSKRAPSTNIVLRGLPSHLQLVGQQCYLPTDVTQVRILRVPRLWGAHRTAQRQRDSSPSRAQTKLFTCGRRSRDCRVLPDTRILRAPEPNRQPCATSTHAHHHVLDADTHREPVRP
jgi:hypothetical protein